MSYDAATRPEAYARQAANAAAARLEERLAAALRSHREGRTSSAVALDQCHLALDRYVLELTRPFIANNLTPEAEEALEEVSA